MQQQQQVGKNLFLVAEEPKLKDGFDNLLKLINSRISLPSYLTNFDEFQKLEANVAIKAWYDVAVNASQPEILAGIWFFISLVVKNSQTTIEPRTLQLIVSLSGALKAIKGKGPRPVDVFISDTSGSFVVVNSSSSNTSSHSVDIKKTIETLLNIVERASEIYYQNGTMRSEKETLKLFCTNIAKNQTFLKSIEIAREMIVKNPDAKDYAISIEIFLSSLKKLQAVKGATVLFGEAFLAALKKHEEHVLAIQDLDKFLAYNFSKPIEKTQEGKILNWLNSISKLNKDVWEARIKQVFDCHYQLNTILAHKKINGAIKRKTEECYEIFKANILSYAQKFKDIDKLSVQLAIFGLIFLDANAYHSRDSDTKEQFQIDAKKQFVETQKNTAKYLCFYIEALNYAVFFQDKTLDTQLNEIKRLTETWKEIQGIEDLQIKYFTQESAEKLLGHFLKTTIIPKSSLASFDSNASIEQLALLKETSSKVLAYLVELKNLYDAFISEIKKFSPKIENNQLLRDFIQRIEQEEKCAEGHLKMIQELPTKNLKQKIEEAILHFRFDVCVTIYMGAVGKQGAKKYCFDEKYQDLRKCLMENFSDLLLEKDLNTPEAWHNFLKKIFTPEEFKVNQVLIYIVGYVYQRNGDISTARKFYDYCLTNQLWEDPQINNTTILIKRENIERRIAECEKTLPAQENSSAAVASGYSSLVPVVPSVFTQEKIDTNSSSTEQTTKDLTASPENAFS